MAVLIAVLASGVPPLYAQSADWDDSEPDLLQTAQGLGIFDTFVQAVDVAGLSSVLENGGPFTLFIPTDEAFCALPSGSMDHLFMEENIEKLIDILTYHIVPGTYTVEESVARGALTTMQENSLPVSIGDEEVLVNGVQVVQEDIPASNGVIHAIEQVLIPPTRAVHEESSE